MSTNEPSAPGVGGQGAGGAGGASPPGPDGRRAVPSWAIIAAAVVVVAILVAVIVRTRSSDDSVSTGGPSTTAAPVGTSAVTSVSTTSTTVVPSSTSPSTTAGKPSSTTSTPSSSTTAAPGALQLRPDGLGVAAFGDDMDTAIAALTTALGAPDDPGTVAPGQCSPRLGRAVRWGNLTVAFEKPDGSDHLVFDALIYGQVDRPAGSTSPIAATPVLTTPGGYGVTDHGEPIEQLLAKARHDFPNAEVKQTADPDSPSLGVYAAPLKFDSLLQRESDGFSVRYIEIAIVSELC